MDHKIIIFLLVVVLIILYFINQSQRKVKDNQNLAQSQLRVIKSRIDTLSELTKDSLKPQKSEENYTLQIRGTKSAPIHKENYLAPCSICPGCETKCVQDKFKSYSLLSLSDWKKAYDANCTICLVKRYITSDIGKTVLTTIFNNLINDQLMKQVGKYVPQTILNKYCTIISNPAVAIDDPSFGFERIFGKTEEEQTKTLTEFFGRAKNELLMYLLQQIPTLGNYITSDNDIIRTIRQGIFDAIDTAIFSSDVVKKMIKYLNRGLAFYLSRNNAMKDLYQSWCKPPQFKSWDDELQARVRVMEEKAKASVQALDALDI
jgi:GTP-binding protein EngB required for normal cell division